MSSFSLSVPFLQDQGFNPIMMFAMLAVVWIFIVILPGRKEKKRKAEMLEQLKKGDEVLVQAGIIGKIHSLKNERVILDFGGTKIPFLRATIVRKIDPSNGNAD